MNLSTLSSYKFANHWLSITPDGKLQAIKKEHALLRLFKSILGKVLHSDYYAHIRLSKVLSSLEKQAINEKVSEAVVCYLKILSNLRQALPAKKGDCCAKIADTILRAHPEMHLFYDKVKKLYVPQQSPFSKLPGRQNGNHNVSYPIHLSIKARIPLSCLSNGSFTKVEVRVPSWKIVTKDRQLPICGPAACYVSDTDIRDGQLADVDVLVEDQEGEANGNGIGHFPNGRIVDIYKAFPEALNTDFSQSRYCMRLVADFTASKK